MSSFRGRAVGLLAGVAGAGMLWAAAAAAADHAVILMYHHVGDDTPPSTSVTVEQFEDHLAYLAEEGFAVWPVERIVSSLRGGGDIPANCVGITFDDAYRSVYERAYPLLKARGMPFTIFVATGGVDAGYRSYLTWRELAEMKENGATIASHSRSHDYLVRRKDGEVRDQWLERVRADIESSRQRIGDETGTEPDLFAWPYGEYTGELKVIIAGEGLTGFGQHSGPVSRGSDFGALPRFPMAGAYAERDAFRIKVRSLPLPVLEADPDDPLLPPEVEKPVLRLRLGPGGYARESLACYAGGAVRAKLTWLTAEKNLLAVEPAQSLPRGRSRYNCTARQIGGTRYYWYSHLWIRGE